MRSVRLRDIPQYLRCGKFYESLDKDNLDEIIEVPDGVLYPTESFSNQQEMEQLFNSLQFWMIEVLPLNLIKCILFTDDISICEVMCRFAGGAFPILATIRDVVIARLCNKEKNQQLLIAIESGFLELVDIMVHSGWKEYCGVSADAAGAGHLHLLKYFHVSQVGKKLNDAVFIASIAGGHVDCLKYAIESGCDYRMSHLVDRAAGHGQLECLTFLHTYKSQRPLSEDQLFCWSATTCARAASSGSLACLKYAHENGCPWDSSTCTWAAADGQTECLEYALRHGCPGGSWTCFTAAENGHLDCLRVAKELGCAWNAEVCAGAAVARGQLDCLRYALQQGCSLSVTICNLAAQEGHVECLRLAHALGCPVDASTYHTAESRAHLPCLEYLQQCNCPRNTTLI